MTLHLRQFSAPVHKIIVMSNGNVGEMGRPTALLKNNSGLLTQLVGEAGEGSSDFLKSMAK